MVSSQGGHATVRLFLIPRQARDCARRQPPDLQRPRWHKDLSLRRCQPLDKCQRGRVYLGQQRQPFDKLRTGLLSDGVRTYTYDHANRLTQVVSGTLTTGFTYPSTSSGQATARATVWPRPWTAPRGTTEGTEARCSVSSVHFSASVVLTGFDIPQLCSCHVAGECGTLHPYWIYGIPFCCIYCLSMVYYRQIGIP
jgi:hypothetical protein